MLLNAETAAVIKVIDPASEIKFECYSQSFMRSAGEIVSLVQTDKGEVHLISYNQAENTIKTIQNYGEIVYDSDPEDNSEDDPEADSEDDPEDKPMDDPEDDPEDSQMDDSKDD